MSTPELQSAEQQAEDRYPEPVMARQQLWPIVTARREAYAIALTERALPAEEALRLAMDYINKCGNPSSIEDVDEAWEALRANHLAAKMLDE